MNIESIHGDGSHLTIDAFNCKGKLDDVECVKDFLDRLPDMIGMTKISEPKVLEHKAEHKDDDGVTGFVIIAESHIAIHTYPNRNFLSADVFSCKEFDVDKAVEFVKEKFKPERVEQKVIQRGHRELYEADKHLEEVKGFDISSGHAKELLAKMKNIGFQATHLGKAAEVLKKMEGTVFLSFTSNMVSSGLREIFAQLVKHKKVDAIVTSTGSVEEDIMKCSKPFLMGDFNISDVDLHKKGINRIGNIFVPDERYEKLEDVLMPFFAELYENQKSSGKMVSPSGLIFELGKKVQDENSILYWATKNNIPIFCPGITDGALGLQLYFFKQKNKEFGIDVTADMDKMADMVLMAEKTSGIVLGGGIAKHHLIGVNILREGLDYAIYVTTSTEADGSLSGARPKEAKSWSKLKEEGNSVCVEGDATILFSLLAMSMMEDD